MKSKDALLAPDDTTAAVTTTPAFDTLVDELAKLSQKHLVFFRIEVGRVTAESLYGGDPDAYRSQAGNKEGSLRQFATEQAERLADLGLTEQSLRQCLQAWFVVQELPRDLVRHLLFSHVVELARVEDGAIRRTLAHAVKENGWGGKELRNAVLAVRAGLPIDADLAAAGLQPPAPAEPVGGRKLQAGRVVSRFERQADDFETTLDEWDIVAADKVTKLQTSRMKATLDRVKAKIADLEGKLGE